MSAARATLAQRLRARRAAGRCGFVPFIEAGDPSVAVTRRHARALTAAGADILELGVPFSDPVADGPTIQAASERALLAGASLQKALAIAAAVRADDGPPVVIFTYLNPALQMGREKFARACARAGVAGALIVDLPAEEWGPWKEALETSGVEPVLLASPTTTDERLRLIARMSGSLIYYVSREGVTGARDKVSPSIVSRLKHVRRQTASRELIVGFGVSTREHARMLAPHCAGVVVGSALVAAGARGDTSRVGKLARDIVAGLSL